MSLHLKFSNDSRALLQELQDTVIAAWKDPFFPPVLLVPNQLVNKWLQLRMAESHGSVVGLKTVYLESFLWKTLEPEAGVQMLDGSTLQQFILATLDQISEQAEFTILFDYLRETDGQISSIRKIQLASKLAQIFLEYEYARPGVLHKEGASIQGFEHCWPKQDYFSSRARDGQQNADLEAWQRALYKQIFRVVGRVEFDAEEEQQVWLSIPALYRQRISEDPRFLENAAKETIYFFSPAGLSHFHRNLLLEISRYRDLFVFQPNPCSSFWEDVDTSLGKKSSPVRLHWESKSDQLGIESFCGEDFEKEELCQTRQFSKFTDTSLYSTPDNRLLELWSHTGKENIALWCQASDYVFHYEEVPPSASSLLGKVQSLILGREASAQSFIHNDSSIRVFEAPSVLCEVEALEDMVWQLLEGKGELAPAKGKAICLSDLCVFVPDLERYRPAIERVFVNIPYVIGSPSAGSSLFSNALNSLLALLHGRFSRKDVLGFLRNPLVLFACGIDQATLSIWETWTEELNIYAGMNSEHRKNLGEHKPSSIHTWRWGIQRLLAGQLAVHPLSLFANGEDDNKLLPYRNMDSSDQSTLEGFCNTIENLFCDLEEFRQLFSKPEEFSFPKLIDSLRVLVQQWIQVPDERSEERFARSAFLSDIAGLSLQEKMGSTFLNFEDFLTLLPTFADSELPSHASIFTGSLNFLEPKSGAILPHRIIFWLGLNADCFPGRDNRSSLDLLSSRRILGDLSPSRQRKYSFLESLCCAEERFWISYLAHDIQKDEILQPSPVVLELEAFLQNSILEKDSWKRYKIPLSPYEALLKHIKTTPDKKQFLPKFSATAMAQAHLLQNQETFQKRLPSPQTEEKHALPKQISILELSRFISDPLQYFLQQHCGLYSSQNEDLALAEWEDLYLDPLKNWKLHHSTWDQILLCAMNSGEESEIESLNKEAYQNFVWEGSAPEGIFLEQSREHFSEKQKEHFLRLQEVFQEFGKRKLIQDDSLDLQFLNDDSNILIEHTIPFILQASDQTHTLVLNTPSVLLDNGKLRSSHRKKLLPYLLFVLARRSVGDERDYQLMILDSSSSCGATFPLLKFFRNQKKALTMLGDLIRSCFERREHYHLPFEAAWDLWNNKFPQSRAGLQAWRDAEKGKSRSGYRPSTDALLLTEPYLPSTEKLQQLFHSTLGILVDGLLQEKRN